MKGQVMAEVFIIGTLILILFLVFLAIYVDKAEGERIMRNEISAKRIAGELAMKIDAASRMNGTSVFMMLPEALDTGDSYNISVRSVGRRVEVMWAAKEGMRSEAIRILTANVSDVDIARSLGSGERTLNITNVDGVVQIA